MTDLFAMAVAERVEEQVKVRVEEQVKVRVEEQVKVRVIEYAKKMLRRGTPIEFIVEDTGLDKITVEQLVAELKRSTGE